MVKAAASRFPGYDVVFKSGFRPGDRRQHGRGNALDVTLVDQRTGQPVPDYQHGPSFRIYEKFAQTVRHVQQTMFPGLSKDLRWGGYFSGKKGKYGAADLMHFDLAGKKIGMAGGSWEKGLTAQQRKNFPGAESVGISQAPRFPDMGPIPANRNGVTPLVAAPLDPIQRAPLRSVEDIAQTNAYRQMADTRALAPASAPPYQSRLPVSAPIPGPALRPASVAAAQGPGFSPRSGQTVPQMMEAASRFTVPQDDSTLRTMVAEQQRLAGAPLQTASIPLPTPAPRPNIPIPAPAPRQMANVPLPTPAPRQMPANVPLPTPAPRPMATAALPPTTPPLTPSLPAPTRMVQDLPIHEVTSGFPTEPAPVAPPRFTAADVYSGRAGEGFDQMGNRVAAGPFGNTSLTNKFGATTITMPNGMQAAGSPFGGSSPIEGPLGQGGIEEPKERHGFGGLKTIGGGLAGARMGGMVGGLPGLAIGGLLGAALGRELSKPGGGMFGGLLGGNRQTALPAYAVVEPSSFPAVPGGGYRGSASFSNRSASDMRDISPAAADAISRGLGGLY